MPSNMPSTALRLLVKTLFSMIIQIIPKQLQENILAKLGRVMWNFSSQMTLVIDEYDELSSINEVFEASQIYLRARTTTSVQELKVSRTAKEEELSVRINKVEKIIDTYEGIQLVWQITNKGKCQSIKLSFCDKYKEKVLSSYLPYVLERSKAIKKETKIVKLYFLWVDGSLRPLNFGHPSTFDTLAMDPPLKKELIDDLDSLGGKAWKRGYLVDGPSGTGKSSLVAAMANYLKFDIYAFELTSRLMSNSELTSLLLSTTKSSIIVIEDIDCSELQNRPDQSDSQKTLGLLDFIDGVWSACGEERIVVITTKDKLHNPTLLSRESMYVHIHMSYCNFCGFKFLASNYLDITNHYMFPEIENLLMEVEVTQADVAKELMKGDGADIALRGLTQLLKMKRIECGGQDGGKESPQRSKTK
ncbi:AAA-ATPase At3g50940-like [Cornus florida]|uniref:AAA-ATPase At3g50940-like n=1 Tax=Cornus florida TaxID=4283 RepID=UPI00289CD13B|nr:AAA-ATPase At3g50940-like [Cornus florida]